MSGTVEVLKKHATYLWTVPNSLTAGADFPHTESSHLTARWKVQFSEDKELTFWGLYLFPIALNTRRVCEIEFTLHAGSPTRPGEKPLAEGGFEFIFEPRKAGVGRGKGSFVLASVIEGISRDENLCFTIEIKEGKPDPPPPPPEPTIPRPFLAFFNNPEYCDVVFEVPGVTAPQLLFSSDFAEASATFKLDPGVPLQRPVERFLGDKDDFAAFAPSLEPPATPVPDTPTPGPSGTAQAEGEASTGANGTPPDDAAMKALQKTGSKTAEKVTSERSEQRAREKTYYRIKLSDCSYATIRTFVYHLYFGESLFLPSMSDYLVAMSAVEVGGTVADAPQWLLRHAKIPPGPGESFEGFCSPHALYRLADCYLVAEVRDVAKKQILAGLTVENAAYEVFSTLSRDYAEIQGGILTFILANWEGVTTSRGWAHALELLDEGALPGGMAVVTKVLGMVAPKPAAGSKPKSALKRSFGRVA